VNLIASRRVFLNASARECPLLKAKLKPASGPKRMLIDTDQTAGLCPKPNFISAKCLPDTGLRTQQEKLTELTAEFHIAAVQFTSIESYC
jgi:hypothetical protein